MDRHFSRIDYHHAVRSGIVLPCFWILRDDGTAGPNVAPSVIGVPERRRKALYVHVLSFVHMRSDRSAFYPCERIMARFLEPLCHATASKRSHELMLGLGVCTQSGP